MHQFTRPLFRSQVHGFFAGRASQMAVFGQLQDSHASIFSRPAKDCVIAFEAQPFFAVADDNFIFSQVEGGLALLVESMRRGVAPEEGSQRGEQLCK